MMAEDQAASSVSTRVRSFDWKTMRIRMEKWPGFFFGSRKISTASRR